MEECQILFKFHVETSIGQHVRIVGDHPKLGNWNPTNALILSTNPNIYPFWISDDVLILKRGIKYLSIKT